MTRHFDANYREVVPLRDGQSVVLRLIRPDDKAQLSNGLALLSSRSRYARFFTDKRTLSAEELVYLTELDQENHFAIGAALLDPDGSELYGAGVARFVRADDDSTVASPAVAVRDSLQRLGLGRLLFLRLVAAARERGIEHFRCEVLPENDAIRKMLKEIARKITEQPQDETLILHMALPVVGHNQPFDASTRLGPMYHVLALAGQGALALRMRWLKNAMRWARRLKRVRQKRAERDKSLKN